MLKLLQRFWDLNIWVKIVFFFCLIGLLSNTILVWRDISHSGILLRLHVGFLVLYAGQVAFILLGERQVWALAVLQGVMALLTNADFTLFPLVRFLGNVVYSLWPDPSLQFLKVYQYVSISLAFTLQMFSAFILFSLLPRTSKPKPVSDSTAN
ncbi:hypothetical protein [Candidatus Avelusimicrobium luingense]|uniref:hypothetical protein n=1 Tax=Candidatus Avelusimicrobium luingense TaxID=3416211 RepID=UPI003D116869